MSYDICLWYSGFYFYRARGEDIVRYMGNKTKLLDELKKVLEKKNLYKDNLIFCDAFCGTCTVGDFFKDKYRVITNDSLYFSYVLANSKIKPISGYFDKLGFDPFEYFNSVDTSDYDGGFCYNNFAPTISGRQYFSDDNAKKIDYIRNTIDEWYKNKKISESEKYYLIACLLESVSKVSNVAGVYSAYLKIWDPRAVKPMVFLPVETVGHTVLHNDNVAYNEDVSTFIKKVKGDILYLDPPYTPTQYISQYHVLETIAKNDNPTTHGKGAHRDNGNQISVWCKRNAVQVEFEKLIANADFKYILFSYSDAGIMPKEYIERVMKRYAKVGTYEFKKISFSKYKSTRAVNREQRENIVDKVHYEWLFFIEKKDVPQYDSPLNYIGGKGDVMNFLKENLPKRIDTFYDLFGGGGTVSINVNANKIIYNELNYKVKELLERLATDNIINILAYLDKQIKKYGLSKANKDAYVNFRNRYNSMSTKDKNPLDLYLLICYGFEHQVRFNKKLEFNNPVGNSGYNDALMEKLISFNMAAHNSNIVFKADDYKKLESEIKVGDFVYCDPPYLISCGAYNDGKRGFNGWNRDLEVELLEFLTRLDKRNVKFMLSNMMDRNGKTNDVLSDWVRLHNYRVAINKTDTLRNKQDRREIVVMNY